MPVSFLKQSENAENPEHVMPEMAGLVFQLVARVSRAKSKLATTCCLDAEKTLRVDIGLPMATHNPVKKSLGSFFSPTVHKLQEDI